MNLLTKLLSISQLLDNEVRPDLETTGLRIFRYILFFLIVACSIIIIVTVLMQSNSSSEGDPTTGIQESYYSKNKGSTRDGKLKIITIVCSAIIMVSVIAYFITEIFNKTQL